MSGPVYCILSGGTVHCVPVTAFNNIKEGTSNDFSQYSPTNSLLEASNALPPQSPAFLSIKKKNLLYTLNNPSLSDLESDVSRRLSTGSHSHDDEEPAVEVLDSQRLRLAAPDSNTGDHYTRAVSPLNTNDESMEGMSGKFSNDNGFAEAVNGTKIMKLGTFLAGEEECDETALTPSILNEYSTHAVYLPQYSIDLEENLQSEYTQIKTLLTKVFPSWTTDISVKQLTGGITNMLLSCSHKATNQTLLMRVYGQGTNLIIDRNREFVSHLVLNSLKLAPSIHARFANGLIYGFLPGRSLEPSELSNESLFPLIAQQLGNWHNSVNCEYIEDGVSTLRKYTAQLKKRPEARAQIKSRTAKGESKSPKSVNNIWDLIEQWIQIVPLNESLVSSFKDNSARDDITLLNIREVVQREFDWLKRTLMSTTKSPVVVSHCDLLSGNIIVPSSSEFSENRHAGGIHLPLLQDNPIQFIDYEYMLPAPRAFDIANHFAEWQGFDCNRSAIPVPSPSNPVMVSWCKGYLNDANAPTAMVNSLIDEISCYYGMPGFYWGIWATIQSELSTIDFNYSAYSRLRLDEYWLWKKQFVSSRLSRDKNGD